MVESRPDRPVREAEDLGDLAEGQAHEVVEDDDGAVVLAQVVEGPPELIAHRDIADAIVGGAEHIREIDDADAEATMASAVRAACPYDKPVGPGIEAIRIAQAGQVAPEGDERLLDRVLGGVRVAQDPAGHEIQASQRGPSQELVRVAVAGLGPVRPGLCSSGVPSPPGGPSGPLTLSVAGSRPTFRTNRSRRASRPRRAIMSRASTRPTTAT